MSNFTTAELAEFLRWHQGRRPLLAAHRGAPRWDEAENCLLTFERALERGATFIEIDVRRTSDGIFVLHHDAKLGRTCAGAGQLATHTLAQLRQLPLLSLDGNTTGQTIPTLDEAVDWAWGRTLLYVDVKPPVTYPEVQAWLHARGAEGLCVTLTFDIRDTLAVHGTSPRAVIYAMTPEERRARELLACGIPHGQLIASIQEHTGQDVYDLLHEHGISVDYPGWAGTDRRAAASGCEVYLPALKLGADIFNTDEPALVFQAIEAGKGGCQPRLPEQDAPAWSLA